MTEAQWETRLDGRPIGTATTRKAAMNKVDRPYVRGPAEVRHRRTGEHWRRHRGSWFQTTPGRRSPRGP